MPFPWVVQCQFIILSISSYALRKNICAFSNCHFHIWGQTSLCMIIVHIFLPNTLGLSWGECVMLSNVYFSYQRSFAVLRTCPVSCSSKILDCSYIYCTYAWWGIASATCDGILPLMLTYFVWWKAFLSPCHECHAHPSDSWCPIFWIWTLPCSLFMVQ